MNVTKAGTDEPLLHGESYPWVDRTTEARELADFILNAKDGLVALYGRYAVGKTTLIKRYVMPILPEDYEVFFEDASIAVDRGIEADDGRISLREALQSRRIIFLDRFERYLSAREDEDTSLRSMSDFLRSPERQGVLVLIMDDAGLEKVLAAAAYLPQLLSATREIHGVDVEHGCKALLDNEQAGALDYDSEFLERLSGDARKLTLAGGGGGPDLLMALVEELRSLVGETDGGRLTVSLYEEAGGVDGLLTLYMGHRIAALCPDDDAAQKLTMALVVEIATREQILGEHGLTDLSTRLGVSYDECADSQDKLVERSGLFSTSRNRPLQFVPSELRRVVDQLARPSPDVRKAYETVEQGYDGWRRLGSPLPRDRFEQVHDIRKELVLHQGFIEFLLHSIPADRERVSESRYWLRRLKDPQLREEFLREWLSNHKDELRLRAAALGAEFPPERRVSVLYKLAMGDTADRVRERALKVLMDIEGAESLRERLELDSIHGELRIRKPALQALHVFQDERNREFILKQALNPDHSESLRAVAVDTLAALDLPAAVDDLRDMTIQNQDPRVRQRATQALLNLQSKEAYERLFTGIRNTPSIVVDDSRRPGLVGILGVVLKIALVGVLLVANTLINGLLLLAGGRYVLGVAIIVAEGFGIWMMEESESLEVIGGIVFALTLALGYILPLGTLLKARSTFKLRSYSFRGILCVILFFVNFVFFLLVHGLAHLLLGRVGRAVALFAAEVAALGAFAMVNYLDPIFYIPGASDLTDAVIYAYWIAGAALFFSSFALDWGVVAVRHVIFFRRVEGKRRRNALLRSVLATPLAAETVTDWAQGPESTNQRWARSVLLEHAEQVPHEKLVNLLENDNPETQKFAIKSLARSKNEELVKELADRWKLARPELSHAIRKIMSIRPTEASVNAFREWTRAQGLREKIRYRMIRARFRIAYWPKSLMVVASLGLPLLMLVTYHAILSYQTEASPLVTFIVRNEDAGIELRVTVANFVADKYPEADMTPVRLIDDFTSGVASLFGMESDSDSSDAQDKDDQPRSVFHELLNVQETTKSCYVSIGLVQSLGIAVSKLEERYADNRDVGAPSQRWTPEEKRLMFEKPLNAIEQQLSTELCRPRKDENPALYEGAISVEDQVTKKALQALNTTVREVPEAFSGDSSHVRSLTDALQTKLDKWGALTALAGIYALSDEAVIEWDNIIESNQQDHFADELEIARQRLMQDINRGADLDIDRVQTRAVTGFNTLAASLLEHAQVIKDEDSERKATLEAQANEFLDHAKLVSDTLVDGEAQSTVRTRKALRRSLR